MEFHEKLQELRKQKGLTQEELASALYVSRAAVSKWESGRGYPHIDSLKMIAQFFSVTIDALLSTDEVLSIAKEDQKEKEMHFRDWLFGLLDVSAALLFFLPFFGQQAEGVIREVSLFQLHGVALYIKIAYAALVAGLVLWGILMLALQNCHLDIWEKNRQRISLILNGLGVFLFIISRQPYAAVLLFVFLAIKIVILLKNP